MAAASFLFDFLRLPYNIDGDTRSHARRITCGGLWTFWGESVKNSHV